MKKLVMMLAAAGVGALAQPLFAQTAAPEQSNTVSSYSAPTVKHEKKAKTASTAKKHWRKKKAASSPQGASQ